MAHLYPWEEGIAPLRAGIPAVAHYSLIDGINGFGSNSDILSLESSLYVLNVSFAFHNFYGLVWLQF